MGHPLCSWQCKLRDLLITLILCISPYLWISVFGNFYIITVNISNFYFPPIIPQPSEAPKETKEAKQTVAEVEVDKHANQNGHPDVEKKKLNKRERKEARQQKNGKSVKSVEKTAAPEQEDEQAGKKKKKDKKRKHGFEDDGDEEQNGDETSSKKKKKTGREIF